MRAANLRTRKRGTKRKKERRKYKENKRSAERTLTMWTPQLAAISSRSDINARLKLNVPYREEKIEPIKSITLRNSLAEARSARSVNGHSEFLKYFNFIHLLIDNFIVTVKSFT
jgi:hypothetical protein